MHELSVLEKGEPRRKSKVCLGKYPYLGQGKENKKKIQKIMKCSNWFRTSGKKANTWAQKQ